MGPAQAMTLTANRTGIKARRSLSTTTTILDCTHARAHFHLLLQLPLNALLFAHPCRFALAISNSCGSVLYGTKMIQVRLGQNKKKIKATAMKPARAIGNRNTGGARKEEGIINSMTKRGKNRTTTHTNKQQSQC